MQTRHNQEGFLMNEPWFPFVRLNPQAKLRLFCFPYSGGGATIFRPWADGLPKTVEVWAAQPPGRETRLSEPPIAHISPLVEAAARAMSPYLDKPFALFGHSVGALAAFELARYFRRQRGLLPVHLLVSAHPAPHVPDPDPPVHDLPQDEFVAELRRYSGTPEMVLENPELLELFGPILRADFAINETYTYIQEPPLDCPISVLAGTDDHKGSRPDFEAWREYTTADFSLRMFQGGHFFIHSASALVLQAISRELDKFLVALP